MTKKARIVKLVLNDIAEFYPYFLAFYIISLIMYFLTASWKMFFNWPAFHATIIILGILCLFSEPVKKTTFLAKNKYSESSRLFIGKVRPTPKFKGKINNFLFKINYFLLYKPVTLVKTFGIIFVIIPFLALTTISKLSFGFVALKIKKLTLRDYLKTAIIIIIMGYALYKGIEAFEFLILTYALLSLFFIIDGRIAAVGALVFLALCPIFLIINRGAMAELFAIYAYYFLIIAVLSQLKEYYLQKGNTIKI